MAAVQSKAWPKAWLNLQACAARVGHKADLCECDDGQPTLVVSRWGRALVLRTTKDPKAFLARVGAPSAQQLNEEFSDVATAGP